MATSPHEMMGVTRLLEYCEGRENFADLQEELRRTAAGLTYYGTYHYCLVVAQSLHYTIPRNRRGHATVSVHKALWDWFDNREDIEGDSDDSAALIAQLARELKGKRADADYNYDESFSDTVSSLIEAQEQIINMVMAWAKGLPDSLRNPP